MANEQYECPASTALGQQCIRLAGHSGRHSAGKASKKAWSANTPPAESNSVRLKKLNVHVSCPKP